jgi:hypothetical protein
LPKILEPDEEPEGELDPGLEPKLEDDPEPKVELVPPPRRPALAFSCSMRGS